MGRGQLMPKNNAYTVLEEITLEPMVHKKTDSLLYLGGDRTYILGGFAGRKQKSDS